MQLGCTVKTVTLQAFMSVVPYTLYLAFTPIRGCCKVSLQIYLPDLSSSVTLSYFYMSWGMSLFLPISFCCLISWHSFSYSDIVQTHHINAFHAVWHCTSDLVTGQSTDMQYMKVYMTVELWYTGWEKNGPATMIRIAAVRMLLSLYTQSSYTQKI